MAQNQEEAYQNWLRSQELKGRDIYREGEIRNIRSVAHDHQHIITQLRAERLAAGLSQIQVGTASGIGQKRISDYEVGRHQPSIGHVVRWAKAIGLDVKLIRHSSRGIKTCQ